MSYVVRHASLGEDQPPLEAGPETQVNWMAYLMPAIGAYVAWNAAKTAIKTAAIAGVVWYLSQPRP